MGSSPLTRGKRRRASHGRLATGLIPAHAGKTRSVPSTATRSWAHPRSRGENLCSRPHHESASGSSPLTRGKPCCACPARCRQGLIPAHAGKTLRRRRTRLGTGAHPRSRGENTAAGLPAAGVGGSSPLTRGKPPRRSPPKSRPGLIPAHAGKTEMSSNHPRPCRAHPRSRGENVPSFRNHMQTRGSSPLTRGKLILLTSASVFIGLIPAHAGKTNICAYPCK